MIDLSTTKIQHRSDSEPKYGSTPGSSSGYKPEIDLPLRLLAVDNDTDWGWLSEALHDSGIEAFELVVAETQEETVAHLRHTCWDVVLVWHSVDDSATAIISQLSPLASADQAWLVFGTEPACDLDESCRASGAAGYVDIFQSDAQTLGERIESIAKLRAANRKFKSLHLEQQKQAEREFAELNRLLESQRNLVGRLSGLAIDQSQAFDANQDDQNTSPSDSQWNEAIIQLESYYCILLQSFVMDDVANWKPSLAKLIDSLGSADVTSSQAIKLHFHALNQVIDGLGGQSTRHVLNRANLLAVELVSRLCDAYQRRGPSLGE